MSIKNRVFNVFRNAQTDFLSIAHTDSDGRKHIAVQARSTNSKRSAYTASGLGDRIHITTLGWAIASRDNIPVVVHIDKSKQVGGQFNNKPESWREILNLFPKNVVALNFHEFEPMSERDWIRYLRQCGYPANTYWYADFPGRYAIKMPLDISPYLSRFPNLLANRTEVEISLPERFVTVQWDSNEKSRTLEIEQREIVEREYEKQGYEIIVVGGLAKNLNLKNSLHHIACAMSKAAFHVGVDSAFMHMAFLFFPFDCIHLYGQRQGFRSHHMNRAIQNGCFWNRYFVE